MSRGPVALLVIVASLIGAWFIPDRAAAAGGASLSVASFGARGDGLTDDRAAIQGGIDALERRGGGTLWIPRGTYLLDSYRPSPHLWFFYNLRVGSNITIRGEPGARLLQGPKGRASMASIPGATYVATSVLVCGSSNYVINTFQTKEYNGGFFPLRATHPNDRTVTLRMASDAARFRGGDYVAIYSSDPTHQDVIPSESTQVTSVLKGGVIGLRHPLARGFTSPVMARVTSLATVNATVSGVILEGTIPLNVNEVFGFTASDDSFICDTSIGGGNIHGLIMNALRGVTFKRNVVTSVGPTYVSLELPQRNSQDVLIASNTFNVSAVGFGEYGAHWVITGNTIVVHALGHDSGAGVFFGGYDVLFSHNLVQGRSNAMPLVADWIGVAAYDAYVGKIRIEDCVFDCEEEGVNCLEVGARDTTVSDNYFNVGGHPGEAILVQGVLPQAVRIRGNTLWVQNGIAIVLNSNGIDHCVVSDNTISGSGPMGIYVTSQPTPNQGEDVLTGNTITGFRTPLSIEMSKHPHAVVR